MMYRIHRTIPMVRAARALTLLALLLSMTMLGDIHSAVAAKTHTPAAGFSTVLLHVERIGTRFAPGNLNLTRVRAGQPLRLVLYAYFSRIDPPATVHVILTGRRGGKAVFRSVGTYTVTRAQLAGFSSGWRWYWNDIGGLAKTPGRLTFTASIGGGGRLQQVATSLTVT